MFSKFCKRVIFRGFLSIFLVKQCSTCMLTSPLFIIFSLSTIKLDVIAFILYSLFANYYDFLVILRYLIFLSLLNYTYAICNYSLITSSHRSSFACTFFFLNNILNLSTCTDWLYIRVCVCVYRTSFVGFLRDLCFSDTLHYSSVIRLSFSISIFVLRSACMYSYVCMCVLRSSVQPFDASFSLRRYSYLQHSFISMCPLHPACVCA